MLQIAAEKSELMREGSTLKSKLVAEKQHAAVLQVSFLFCACIREQLSLEGYVCMIATCMQDIPVAWVCFKSCKVQDTRCSNAIDICWA